MDAPRPTTPSPAHSDAPNAIDTHDHPPRLRSFTHGWARGYSPRTVGVDAFAGLTLAAYALPAAIGDAFLARLPPECGLYACIFSGLVFWTLCSSRRTVVTVTSAISLLVGSTLGAMTSADPARFAALASGTALLVALLGVLAWLVRAGSLVSFVSETVLVGFKIGVALVLAGTQIPKLMGMSSAHGSFWHCLHHIATHLHETNAAALTLGLGALGMLVVGKIVLKRVPIALVVVIAGIAVTSIAGLSARGVKLLGEVPQGLPPIGLPAITVDDLNELLPLAMACFLLAAVETTAIGRMFAAKYRTRLDPNQEFLALAGANLASGLGHGLPVSGGMSQSLVNESAGARTPISGLIAALLMLVVAVLFSSSLRDLPQPVLAAIVLMAVASLVNVSALKRLWQADRAEFLVAMVALAGVLASGLLRGVLIGAVISMILLVRRAARPHVAFLGRIPNSNRYSDLERHPENELEPGVLIFRPEASLVYFNAEHVYDAVIGRARASAVHNGPLRAVIGDLSGSPFVDMAGAEMLDKLCHELAAMGVEFRLVEARSSVRDRLRRQGVPGDIDRLTSVSDAVAALRAAS